MLVGVFFTPVFKPCHRDRFFSRSTPNQRSVMSDKPVDAVIAESKALIAEHEALAARLDHLVEEATAMAARAAGRDPATFDIEAYLRETLSTAEYEKVAREAREQWDKMAADQGVRQPSTVYDSMPSARPAGVRPHRRMV